MKIKKFIIFMFFSSFLLFLTSCEESLNTFKVTFVDFDNTVLKTQEVQKGSNANAPKEPTRIGYTFEKWDKDFTNVKRDITVLAVYKPNIYEVKFVENGGSEVDDINIEFDKPLELAIPTKKGYNFAGWFKESNLINRFNDTTVPIDGITLYAKWDLIEYNITFNTYNDSIIEPIIVSYYETVEELPIPTKPDYSFVGWILGDEYIRTPFTFDYVENIELKAVWRSLVDLDGYKITIVESQYAYGNPTINPFSDAYNLYDKEAKKKAWLWVEDKYNCKIEVVGYPEMAEWGIPRWTYIEEQANGADYDFYTVPDSQIYKFASSNSIRDITDWYNQHGKGYMSPIYKQSGTSNGKLYSITNKQPQISNVMYYNINLLERLGLEKSPAQLFLDGEWTYSKFKEYATLAQSKLNVYDSIYYAVAGCSPYYWVGMSNAGGLSLASVKTLNVNILNQISIDAATTLRDIKQGGAMSPIKETDASITSWMQGRALFATGDLWFVKTSNRWPANLWGEDTRYGYVPFPRPDGTPLSSQKIGIPGTDTLVMTMGKNYEGYAVTCTPENVYRAIAETFNKTEEFLEEEGVTFLDELNKNHFKYTDSEDSFQAFYYIQSRINEIGFFEPIANPDNNIINTGYSQFSSAIDGFVMGDLPNFKDAVSPFIPEIEKNLVKHFI